MSTTAPENDTTLATLDAEINNLQTHARRLKAHLTQHKANILSHASQSPQCNSQTPAASASDLLLDDQKAQQTAHNHTTLHRLTSGITAFPTLDPDPNVTSSGKLLGLRLDSFDAYSGTFQNPYYVFLHKPYGAANRDVLRVHRHTLPPAINIAALAKRWLPAPVVGHAGGLKTARTRQDLSRFVRELRREVVGFNYRLAVVKGLRRDCGLDGGKHGSLGRGSGVVDVSAVDAEGRQVRIEWDDGRIGRLVVGSKGEVLRCLVMDGERRCGDVENRILGNGRVEGLAGRL